MQLTVELVDDILRVRGEVDSVTAPELSAQASRLADCTPNIVIDCSGVTFIDSAGLNALIDVHQHAQSRGGGVTVRNPSDLVTRLLSLTGLEEILTIAS